MKQLKVIKSGKKPGAPPKWSTKKVIQGIRERVKSNLALGTGAMLRDNSALYWAAKNRFGNWRKAIRLAGLNPNKFLAPHHRWTAEKLITAVHEWLKRYPPSSLPYKSKTWGNLREQVKTYFPDPKTRAEKLGVAWPPYFWGKWTAEGIVQAIKERVKKGKKINPTTVILENLSLYRGCRSRFGSYRKAIKVAGLDYKAICHHPIWTTEKVIQEIKERYRQGLPLNPGSFRKSDSSLYSYGKRFFGSWAATLQAANLDPKQFYLNRMSCYGFGPNKELSLLARH
ncbi:MAG: hypothetical protein V1709_09325, partial [Planctomycetota bacterium]